ncbi:MAG: hypothetical protein FWF76_04270 [Oscillospiraceae bacterium]|nr:hypothetical protein [Oscillospiraceae bacterium]
MKKSKKIVSILLANVAIMTMLGGVNVKVISHDITNYCDKGLFLDETRGIREILFGNTERNFDTFDGDDVVSFDAETNTETYVPYNDFFCFFGVDEVLTSTSENANSRTTISGNSDYDWGIIDL